MFKTYGYPKAAMCMCAILSLLLLLSQEHSNEYMQSFMKENAMYTQKVKVAPSILFGGAAISGFLICFWGYRLIKPTLFLSGLVGGALIGYDLSHEAFQHRYYGDFLVLFIVLGCGSVLAFASVLLYRVGIAILGVASGILFAEYLHTAFLHLLYPRNPLIVLYISMTLFGIGFGMVSNRNEKPIIILMTAWLGAYECVRGLGYFFGGYPSPTDMFRKRRYNRRVPNAYWGYFIGTIFLFLFGLCIQIFHTAKYIDHEEDSDTCEKEDSDGYQRLEDQPTAPPCVVLIADEGHTFHQATIAY